MIKAENMTFMYPDGHEALAATNFHVARGSLVGLVGANGSGKSTLLAMLAGLYTPESGKLVVDGHVSPGCEADIRGVCRLVMQDADLQILGGTVGEDVLLGRDDDRSEESARIMLDRFGLAGKWECPVHSLSWGMKRKLCLAGALLDQPGVLLLDEPFSGLDYPGILEMRRLLRGNREAGLTQVVAVHDLECLIDLADCLFVLNKGTLVLNGRPEDVLDSVREHGVRPPCSWTACRSLEPWDSAE